MAIGIPHFVRNDRIAGQVKPLSGRLQIQPLTHPRERGGSIGNSGASNVVFDFPSGEPQNGSGSLQANPTSGGVTASTEMLAAKRHAGVHTPVIECKMIIANQQMAYAA